MAHGSQKATLGMIRGLGGLHRVTKTFFSRQQLARNSLELGVRSHLGRAAGVTAATPLRTQTSFSSVCHDLRLKIELDHAG